MEGKREEDGDDPWKKKWNAHIISLLLRRTGLLLTIALFSIIWIGLLCSDYVIMVCKILVSFFWGYNVIDLCSYGRVSTFLLWRTGSSRDPVLHRWVSPSVSLTNQLICSNLHRHKASLPDGCWDSLTIWTLASLYLQYSNLFCWTITPLNFAPWTQLTSPFCSDFVTRKLQDVWVFFTVILYFLCSHNTL